MNKAFHQTGQINYWLFQCNPDYYDIVGALNQGLPMKWRVAAHKHRIHPQDKVILWVSGAIAGCYALAEVTSEVELTSSYDWESEFQIGVVEDEPEDMVEITILHNMANSPLLKMQLLGIAELEDMYTGFRGTNFRATAEQYNALEKLATSNSKVGK